MRAPESDHLGFIPNVTIATFSQLLPFSKSQFPQREDGKYNTVSLQSFLQGLTNWGQKKGLAQGLASCELSTSVSGCSY